MAETDISGKRTRKAKVAIHWLKLGEAKDPEFGKVVLLYDKKESNPDHGVMTGFLKGIESDKGIKVFRFVTGSDADGNDIIGTRYTHYANITPPVE